MAAMTKSRSSGTLISRKRDISKLQQALRVGFEILPDGKGLPHLQTRIGLSSLRLVDDDVDVLADGAVVRRIVKANAVRRESPWMWTLLFRTAPEMVWRSQIERPRSRQARSGPLYLVAIDDLDQ